MGIYRKKAGGRRCHVGCPSPSLSPQRTKDTGYGQCGLLGSLSTLGLPWVGRPGSLHTAAPCCAAISPPALSFPVAHTDRTSDHHQPAGRSCGAWSHKVMDAPEPAPPPVLALHPCPQGLKPPPRHTSLHLHPRHTAVQQGTLECNGSVFWPRPGWVAGDRPLAPGGGPGSGEHPAPLGPASCISRPAPHGFLLRLKTLRCFWSKWKMLPGPDETRVNSFTNECALFV